MIPQKWEPVLQKDHTPPVWARLARPPAPNFASSDAATSAPATTAIMIVQTALISGFTPEPHLRIDADRQRGRAGARGEACDHQVVEREREGQHPAGRHRGR